MSAFVTEYPDVVRAVVSDVGIITDVISQGDFHLTNNGHSKFLFRIPPEA